MNETNYAISHKVKKPLFMEFICLMCFKTWYVQKTLGNDNVWRTLPGWCRTCSPCRPVALKDSGR